MVVCCLTPGPLTFARWQKALSWTVSRTKRKSYGTVFSNLLRFTFLHFTIVVRLNCKAQDLYKLGLPILIILYKLNYLRQCLSKKWVKKYASVDRSFKRRKKLVGRKKI